MADFVLARKSRNILSTVLHVILNILLGFTAVFSTVILSTPVLGLLLVFISKWRVLAVRTRYWWPNIKANLVDLIVGVSIVMLTYFAQPTNAGQENIAIDFLFAIVYSIWLLFIKPLSSEKAAIAQSLIAVFLGISATILGTSTLNIFVTILLAFVIGYAASRHILSQSDDRNYTLTTLCCGLVFAEITWLCASWSIIYPIAGLRIPQAAIILTIFTFIYNYARQIMVKYQEDFRFKQILGPVIFGIILIGIIVLAFSNPIFNV